MLKSSIVAKKVKIVVFAPFYPPHIGGLENYIQELNYSLAKLNNEIIVFTPRIPQTSAVFEIDEGIRVVRYPAIEPVEFYPIPKIWNINFWKSMLELKKYNPDIVMSHTRFFFSSFMSLLFSWFVGSKHVHIELGSDFVKMSNKLTTIIARIYDYTFGALVLRKTNLNVSVSTAVRDFTANFAKRRSVVLHAGVNTDYIDSISPDTKIKMNFENKIIIMFAGRLVKWKGIHNTIGAINMLPPELKKKIVFLVVGYGGDRQKLEEISDETVVFIGKKTRDQTISIMKSADIYIHASLQGGGLSTSVLEAMYSGCLLIASPHEGARDVVNSQNGILLKDSSQELIFEALMEVLPKYKYYKKRTRVAQKTIQKDFGWESVKKLNQKLHNL